MIIVSAEALELKLQPLQWLLGPVLGSLRAARAVSPVPSSALQCAIASSSVMMRARLVGSSSCAERSLAFSCL